MHYANKSGSFAALTNYFNLCIFQNGCYGNLDYVSWHNISLFLWTTVHYLKHISKYVKYLRHSIHNCELITGVQDRNAKIIVFGFIWPK